MTDLAEAVSADERVVLVRIESIRMGHRHRKQLGDIDGLAQSIKSVGQLQPIVLRSDSTLVIGGRRIEALRLLGLDLVRAVFRDDLDDVARALRAERDENTCREPMKPSELAALGAELEEIERPKATGRRMANLRSVPGNRSEGEQGNTTKLVANAVGMSESSYKRARQLYQRASDPDVSAPEQERAQRALEEMDRTGTVKPVYESWRAGATFATADTPPVEDTATPEVREEPAEPALAAEQPPAKRPPNRKPLPEAFQRAGWDLLKSAERLERLADDDRFPRNAEQVARMSRSDLQSAADLLAVVISRLPTSAQ